MFEVVIDWREGFPECGEMGVFFLSIGIWLCLDVIEWIFLSACHNRNRSCAQKCLLHLICFMKDYTVFSFAKLITYLQLRCDVLFNCKVILFGCWSLLDCFLIAKFSGRDFFAWKHKGTTTLTLLWMCWVYLTNDRSIA